MISKDFHASRRALYASVLKDDSVGFVFAGREREWKGDEMYPFIPYANFYYLTGFTYPEAVLMVVKRNGHVRETLFIDHPDEKAKRWTGVSYTKESVKEQTGIGNVDYLERFEQAIPLFGEPGLIRQIYIDIPGWERPFVKNEAREFASRLHDFDPTIPIYNTFQDLAYFRQVKTKEEIALHRTACDITAIGVKNILSHLRPGMHEYEIEAYFDFSLKSHHADHAFPTIAASGINACCMHYDANDRQMEKGDLILFDLGARWGGYNADVSRTFPVSGRFTEQQKALYEVVLKGLEVAIAASKPGQPKNELQDLSKQAMAKELIRLSIIQEPEEINRYYFHGSGHYIGLYTHDVGDDNAPLEEDMVFTLEPGLYFDDLGIGIRIEDTLLVTKDGCEVLSGGIPKTVEEIETFMQEYAASNETASLTV